MSVCNNCLYTNNGCIQVMPYYKNDYIQIMIVSGIACKLCMNYRLKISMLFSSIDILAVLEVETSTVYTWEAFIFAIYKVSTWTETVDALATTITLGNHIIQGSSRQSWILKQRFSLSIVLMIEEHLLQLYKTFNIINTSNIRYAI